MKRRERTRHLIELGGLVVKSGLIDISNDDRTVLYGAFLELILQLQPETREQVIALWRRQGGRAFKAEAEERNKQAGRHRHNQNRPE